MFFVLPLMIFKNSFDDCTPDFHKFRINMHAYMLNKPAENKTRLKLEKYHLNIFVIYQCRFINKNSLSEQYWLETRIMTLATNICKQRLMQLIISNDRFVSLFSFCSFEYTKKKAPRKRDHVCVNILHSISFYFSRTMSIH